MWVVQFYAPWCGHCKQFKPMFIQLAKGFKGIVKFGLVDGTEQGIGDVLANEYNISGFPTVKIFGADKKNPKTYDGPRAVPDMVQVVGKRVPNIKGGTMNDDQKNDKSAGDSKAVDLTASNIQSLVYDSPDVWMVAFIAPWCGHCKQLLPEWKMAADSLHGQGVQLGIVDATAEESLGAEYGIRGFPTIKVFPGGAGKSKASAVEYQGGRSASDIVREALAEVDRSGAPPTIP